MCSPMPDVPDDVLAEACMFVAYRDTRDALEYAIARAKLIVENPWIGDGDRYATSREVDAAWQQVTGRPLYDDLDGMDA